MSRSETCCNNNKHNSIHFDNPLTSRRTDGGKKEEEIVLVGTVNEQVNTVAASATREDST